MLIERVTILKDRSGEPWWLEGTTVELGPFGVQLFSVHIYPFPVVVVVFRISF